MQLAVAMQLAIAIIVLKFSLAFELCTSHEAKKSFPRVTTSLGTIEGYCKTSSNGRRYEAYEGIPYAKPPIGKLRFEIPKSISPWKGILKAKRFGPQCIQYNVYMQSNARVEGSEDCLYLNVYTPAGGSKSNKPLPVIFFIHGGAFRWGSGSQYGPKDLLNENVVFVTINYRLGILGFLSTEDHIIPGNMGLKDQVVALRWVNDYIKSFGGDPSRITIFGSTAGSASVHYLYLTKLTAGLFQRGMSITGTTLSSWAQTEDSLEKAKKLATMFGCSTDNIQIMVNCLKHVPAAKLTLALLEFSPWLMLNPVIAFGPTVEKTGGNFTYIDRPPMEIITSDDAHDLPWITGVVSGAGLGFTALFVANPARLKELDTNWVRIAPLLLDYNFTIPTKDHAKVARLARQHYLRKRPIDNTTTKQITQMLTDREFGYAAGYAAQQMARVNKSPVRFYYFSYRGAHSLTEFITNTTRNYGVDIMDEVAYVLEKGIDTSSTPTDRAMKKKLIRLWVTYATTGIPDVGGEWKPVSRNSQELDYLHIAAPNELGMKRVNNFGDRRFWKSLNFQENLISNGGYSEIKSTH